MLFISSQATVSYNINKKTFLRNSKRIKNEKHKTKILTIFRQDFLVGEDGFEPSKRSATDLQSAPFGHSGTLPYSVSSGLVELVDGFEPPTC